MKLFYEYFIKILEPNHNNETKFSGLRTKKAKNKRGELSLQCHGVHLQYNTYPARAATGLLRLVSGGASVGGYMMVIGVYMFCPASPAECKTDNESSLFQLLLIISSTLVNHCCGNRLLTKKEVLRNYTAGSSGHKMQTVMKLI